LSKQAVILIVDDDPDERAGLKVLLELKDLKVLEAENAEQCLNLLENQHPDLLILDIMMERKNSGFELVYQLHKDPELKKIPIILLSNLPNLVSELNPEKEERYLPVVKFFAKPIAPELLYQEIERILGISLS